MNKSITETIPLHLTLTEPYVDLQQQQEAATLGMWLFLASEIMFFGSLFIGYFVFRLSYRQEFIAGGQLMNLGLGTLNTAVLLTSSLFMALAVYWAKVGNRKKTAMMLMITSLLGCLFVAIKFFEYYKHTQDGLLMGFSYTGGDDLKLFLTTYYIMTGIHTIHVLMGIMVCSYLSFKLFAKRTASAPSATFVENTALYWHFVDIVWVFLYPLFYLIS